MSWSRSGARKEVLSLAWPVLATLVADPLAGLVALYFIGMLGEVQGKIQLAACGTATSIFNTTLKVFNVPLLSVATSSLAAVKGRSEGDPAQIGSAASSAIITALAMSAIEACLLGFGAPVAAVIWQVKRESPMYPYLLRYLWVRGFGSPVTLLMLTLQGIFRGLKEVKEPLYATVINNLANIVLCPIMLFVFKLESPGAAASILLGEAAACVYLITRLTKKYPIRLHGASTFRELASLLPATGWLMLRTASLTATYAVATAVTNTTDVAYSAAHQVMFTLWMATTMLADSMAVAAQTMISASLAKFNHKFCHVVIAESVRLAFYLGLILTAVTFMARHLIPHFTSSPDVVAVMTNFVYFIVFTQPITSQAFVWDGILYGVSGFKYASVAISSACVLPVMCMVIAYYSDKLVDAGQGWNLFLTFGEYLTSREAVVMTWVWIGLCLLMLMRILVIAVPYLLQLHPFSILYMRSLQEYEPLVGDEKDSADEKGLELPVSPSKEDALLFHGKAVTDLWENGQLNDCGASSSSSRSEPPVFSCGVEVQDADAISYSSASQHGAGSYYYGSSSSLLQDYRTELEPTSPASAIISEEPEQLENAGKATV